VIWYLRAAVLAHEYSAYTPLKEERAAVDAALILRDKFANICRRETLIHPLLNVQQENVFSIQYGSTGRKVGGFTPPPELMYK